MTSILWLLILVAVGKVQELIPGSQYAKPVLLTLIVGIVGHFVFRSGPTKGFKAWRPPLVYWALMTLGLMASIPTSLWPSRSFTFVLYRHMATSILMLLVATHLSTLRKLEKNTQSLLWCVFILGIAIIVVPSSVSDWDGRVRTTVGESYDPNDLAMAVVMTVPFMVYWFWRKGSSTKAFSVICCLLSAIIVQKTGSRGGMLAFGVIMVYLVVAVREIGVPLRMMLGIGILAGGLLATQTSTFESLILALQGKDYNTTSDEGRLETWKRGVGYALTHPVTGVGIDCFDIAEGTLAERPDSGEKKKWSAAHNSFVQVMAEAGFPCFLFWCLMIVTTFREIRRQRKVLWEHREDIEVQRLLMMGAMIRGSLIAFLISGFFLSMAYFVLLFLLIGYVLALANITDDYLLDVDEEESGHTLQVVH